MTPGCIARCSPGRGDLKGPVYLPSAAERNTHNDVVGAGSDRRTAHGHVQRNLERKAERSVCVDRDPACDRMLAIEYPPVGVPEIRLCKRWVVSNVAGDGYRCLHACRRAVAPSRIGLEAHANGGQNVGRDDACQHQQGEPTHERASYPPHPSERLDIPQTVSPPKQGCNAGYRDDGAAMLP